jgi:MFS family permease
LLAGGLVDKFGRRNMIIFNACVFVIGALMISGTSTFFIFLLGRFTLGFAVALSAIAECIYISELSIPAKRGMLVSFNELAITVGILMAFLVNYILADIPGGWRIMFSLSIGIAIIQVSIIGIQPRVSVQGVKSLWSDCRFIPEDCWSWS